MSASGTRGREEIPIFDITASPPYAGMVTMKVNLPDIASGGLAARVVFS